FLAGEANFLLELILVQRLLGGAFVEASYGSDARTGGRHGSAIVLGQLRLVVRADSNLNRRRDELPVAGRLGAQRVEHGLQLREQRALLFRKLRPGRLLGGEQSILFFGCTAVLLRVGGGTDER